MKILALAIVCFAQTFNQSLFAKELLQGSGTLATEMRTVAPFEKLMVRGSVDVFLKQGDEIGVEVEADDNIVQFITTDVKRKSLYVGLEHPSKYRGIKPKQEIKVFVTAPTINSIQINGSGDVTGEGVWKFEGIDLFISGSGDIKLSFNGENLNASIQGSGTIALDGTVAHQTIRLSGSGGYNGKGLQSESASVIVNGSGDVHLNVKDHLDVKLSGSGDVIYEGNPQLSKRISGSGRISRI
ncbi:MAG: hypothetical protein S4CHLAM45_04150 [Chlamydiales bacterium]|nr:hypothetical protein [Chlamydiales bacterium]MCH9619269.1 hypothetical protein [Chlamydiales bacterium]MCH9622531.1 hypothetical protein [Chlamydiales bacterium]